MPEASTKPRPRVLKPMERLSEVWFGLIMVLTLTCSLSVTGADRGEVRTMLFAALGCNLAWGIIDGFMYLTACFSERGHALQALRALRRNPSPAQTREILAEALPPSLLSSLSPEELQAVQRRLSQLPDPPRGPFLTRDDWLGALAVFLLVFLSTFPVVVPFFFLRDAKTALRVSNGVAIVLLFVTGRAVGRYAGYHPWGMGAATVLVGGALVAVAIALGG